MSKRRLVVIVIIVVVISVVVIVVIIIVEIIEVIVFEVIEVVIEIIVEVLVVEILIIDVLIVDITVLVVITELIIVATHFVFVIGSHDWAFGREGECPNWKCRIFLDQKCCHLGNLKKLQTCKRIVKRGKAEVWGVG